MFAAEIALMTYNKYHAEQQANIVNNLPHVPFYNINIMQELGKGFQVILKGNWEIFFVDFNSTHSQLQLWWGLF
jgi:hypothetical protein